MNPTNRLSSSSRRQSDLVNSVREIMSDPIMVNLMAVPAGMGVSALKALYLIRHDELTLSQLSTHLGLTAAAMTGTVDTMEHQSLATRQPHPADRRKTLVLPTRSGEELAKRIFES